MRNSRLSHLIFILLFIEVNRICHLITIKKSFKIFVIFLCDLKVIKIEFLIICATFSRFYFSSSNICVQINNFLMVVMMMMIMIHIFFIRTISCINFRCVGSFQSYHATTNSRSSTSSCA